MAILSCVAKSSFRGTTSLISTFFKLFYRTFYLLIPIFSPVLQYLLHLPITNLRTVLHTGPFQEPNATFFPSNHSMPFYVFWQGHITTTFCVPFFLTLYLLGVSQVTLFCSGLCQTYTIVNLSCTTVIPFLHGTF
jgi:hypothetical protein